jgi:hypothetical protein
MTDIPTAVNQISVLNNAIRDIGLVSDAHLANMTVQRSLDEAQRQIRAAFDEISRLAHEVSLSDVAANCDRISENMAALARSSTPPPTLRNERIDETRDRE